MKSKLIRVNAATVWKNLQNISNHDLYKKEVMKIMGRIKIPMETLLHDQISGQELVVSYLPRWYHALAEFICECNNIFESLDKFIPILNQNVINLEVCNQYLNCRTSTNYLVMNLVKKYNKIIQMGKEYGIVI